MAASLCFLEAVLGGLLRMVALSQIATNAANRDRTLNRVGATVLWIASPMVPWLALASLRKLQTWGSRNHGQVLSSTRAGQRKLIQLKRRPAD